MQIVSLEMFKVINAQPFVRNFAVIPQRMFVFLVQKAWVRGLYAQNAQKCIHTEPSEKSLTHDFACGGLWKGERNEFSLKNV